MVHHLRSSWAMLNMERPLWELHELLNSSTEYPDKDLQLAINAVLVAGRNIISSAKEKKKEVTNG